MKLLKISAIAATVLAISALSIIETATEHITLASIENKATDESATLLRSFLTQNSMPGVAQNDAPRREYRDK